VFIRHFVHFVSFERKKNETMSESVTPTNVAGVNDQQGSSNLPIKPDATLTAKTTAAIATERTPVANGDKPTNPTVEPTKQTQKRFACRMFFPSSGRMGFDLVKVSDEMPPIGILREMILYETRLRLSESIQDLMDQYHDDEESVT
jgi:hypothetical protein